MKKASRRATEDLRPKYQRSDFGTLVRGKYAQRVIEATNVVVLDPKVARAFPMIVPSTRHCEGCFAIASPPLAQLPVQHGRAASGAPVNGTLDDFIEDVWRMTDSHVPAGTRRHAG